MDSSPGHVHQEADRWPLTDEHSAQSSGRLGDRGRNTPVPDERKLLMAIAARLDRWRTVASNREAA